MVFVIAAQCHLQARSVAGFHFTGVISHFSPRKDATHWILQRPEIFASRISGARRNMLKQISATILNADAISEESNTLSDKKNGAWLPIGSAKQLVGDVPVSIELIGEKFVVWRNGTTWSVMRDVCPHRLAPLSQGRVDPTTGCIECPYHGWQFALNGACTKIPQLPADQRRVALGDEAMDRTGATSFPVRMTGDMIWAFLPLPPGQVMSGSFHTHPASGGSHGGRSSAGMGVLGISPRHPRHLAPPAK